MSIVTNSQLREQINLDNKNIFTAGLVLKKIHDSLRQITLEKKFMAMPRNHMEKYPHLAERIEEFNQYSEALSSTHFTEGWYAHLGALVAPWYKRGGNIHLYLIDFGLLSKSLNPIPELVYDQRSAFFLNRVFGFDISDQRVKGAIHLHVLDINDLTSRDVHGIRNAIANEHESRGKYIKTCTFRAFSLREDCSDGGIVTSSSVGGESLRFLAMNSPKFLAQKLSAK